MSKKYMIGVTQGKFTGGENTEGIYQFTRKIINEANEEGCTLIIFTAAPQSPTVAAEKYVIASDKEMAKVEFKKIFPALRDYICGFGGYCVIDPALSFFESEKENFKKKAWEIRNRYWIDQQSVSYYRKLQNQISAEVDLFFTNVNLRLIGSIAEEVFGQVKNVSFVSIHQCIPVNFVEKKEKLLLEPKPNYEQIKTYCNEQSGSQNIWIAPGSVGITDFGKQNQIPASIGANGSLYSAAITAKALKATSLFVFDGGSSSEQKNFDQSIIKNHFSGIVEFVENPIF